MNIFVTDPDPVKSAEVCLTNMWSRYHLRLARCWLSFILNGILTGVMTYYRRMEHIQPQKGAFRGHPCTIWAAQNIYNTAWLIQHGFGLLQEYTHRYGKVHSCQTVNE